MSGRLTSGCRDLGRFDGMKLTHQKKDQSSAGNPAMLFVQYFGAVGPYCAMGLLGFYV